MAPVTKKPATAGPDSSAGLGEDRNGAQALDTLASVIRSLGQHALELAELQPRRFAELCEGWATHLLLLKPPPGEGMAVTARRDWEGLRRFVKEHRLAEQALVQKSMGDLRDVVSTFIDSINHTFEDEQLTDKQVLSDMRDFCANIERRSTDEIKRSAVAISGALSDAFERRKARHTQQMEEMGQQVDSLGMRLTEAERERSLDPLTSLYNRRVLDASLAEAVSLKRNYGHRATLAVLDVDHFKAVNDTHGHSAGDAVLKALGDTLVRCFPRRSDVVVRFGGEEFAVLLSDTGEGDAANAVRRLQDAVRSTHVCYNGVMIRVTVSVGIAELKLDQPALRWIDEADACMYLAKQRGRDQAVLASARE
jgi:diguanylate cyclase (GGDEF)-like protein